MVRRFEKNTIRGIAERLINISEHTNIYITWTLVTRTLKTVMDYMTVNQIYMKVKYMKVREEEGCEKNI